MNEELNHPKPVQIITADPFTLAQYWKLMKKHRSFDLGILPCKKSKLCMRKHT
jgi:hypothetical protein